MTFNKQEYMQQYYEDNKEEWLGYNQKSETEIKRKEYSKLKIQTRELIIQLFKQNEGCGICKSKENLEIHHWRNRLPIKRQDFSILCKDCHKKIHSKGLPFS